MASKIQTQSDPIQIRIECKNKREFCWIHPTKLTMESFLRDGKPLHSTNSIVFILCLGN